MKQLINDKLYDILKFVAQYVLPATASLYFGLASIWGLPYAEQIVGTIVAIDTALGGILGIVVYQYRKANKMIGDDYVQVPAAGCNDMGYTPVLANRTYDILYWITQLVLPSLGTLYFTIASIWGLAYGEQVVGTIALIDTFLGIFLGLNSKKYQEAVVVS